MKSKKAGKLFLNKSTVAKLNNDQLDALKGGWTSTFWSNCDCDSNIDTTCNGTTGGSGPFTDGPHCYLP